MTASHTGSASRAPDQRDDLPAEVATLAQRAAAAVQSAYGVTLDYSETALAFLDALLRGHVAELGRQQRHELLTGIGAHFGEVCRRRLGGHWALAGTDPGAWRIEAAACFLHFRPIGMAGECLLGCESAAYDGAFATTESLREDLDERLRLAPPLGPTEYFSLSGRLEVLTLVTDWLVARQLVSDEGPRTFGPEEYRQQLEQVGARSTE